MEMKIKVEHKVSPDETKCIYGGDFWGRDVCMYHTHRDRTHGRKAPIERRVPKCILFDCWLHKEYQKCDACIESCNETKEFLEKKVDDLQKVSRFQDIKEV